MLGLLGPVVMVLLGAAIRPCKRLQVVSSDDYVARLRTGRATQRPSCRVWCGASLDAGPR